MKLSCLFSLLVDLENYSSVFTTFILFTSCSCVSLQPICAISFVGVLKEQTFEFMSIKLTPQNLSFTLHGFSFLGFLEKGILMEKLTIVGEVNTSKPFTHSTWIFFIRVSREGNFDGEIDHRWRDIE